MAVEVESEIVAWVQVGAVGVPIVDPATQFWRGQGISSVTRNGLGDYTVTLDENLDPNDLIQFTPDGNFPSNQVSITGANTISFITFDVAAGPAVPADYLLYLHVMRFNVEAQRQVVS